MKTLLQSTLCTKATSCFVNFAFVVKRAGLDILFKVHSIVSCIFLDKNFTGYFIKRKQMLISSYAFLVIYFRHDILLRYTTLIIYIFRLKYLHVCNDFSFYIYHHLGLNMLIYTKTNLCHFNLSQDMKT